MKMLRLQIRTLRRASAPLALGISFVLAGIHVAMAQEPVTPDENPSATAAESASGSEGPARVSRLQAKSEEEAAAYQAFLEEKDLEKRIRMVEDFLLFYPETELKESAYQVAMQSYYAKRDYVHALTYGEMVLAENPENVTALLTLATAVAESIDHNDFDSEERMDEGVQYARQALEALGTMRRRPGVPEEPWNEAKRESESVAHAALGLIALIREDFMRAELELKEAVALTQRPDPALLYRLGMSYSFQKKYAEAVEVLDRAASLGGIKIAAAGGGTRDLVAEAREFASKALGGSTQSQVAPLLDTPEAETPELRP